MSSTRLSEYLDHQALVAKLADVSEQCYKLLQLSNDLEKNLNDHNTDPEAHLDIRKAIEVVSGRLDTANTAFNTHISNIKNTYDAEVAELKKKDTDLENNLGKVSDKLDTVEKGEHVYDNSIKSEVVADDILAAAKGDAIIQSTTDKDGVVMLASLESPSGIYTLGSNHDEFEVNFHSDSDLAKNSPAATQSVVLLDKNGNSKFGKNVSAEQFTGSLVGNVTGNADTASDASRFNGLVTTDFIRTTDNVNQTITGTKTFKSPIVGNLQGTASNADKLDNLDSSDFVRRTDDVAETITGDKTFSAIVYGDNFQPKSGNKTGTIGTNSNGYKTIYVEHVEASTIAGNVTGNLTGNADTATKLRTPRKINGTDFDGTTAIVTEIWGTTRNFYIADSTGKHTGIPIGVNGSGTVTLRLPGVIKADLIGNVTGNAATATKLDTATLVSDLLDKVYPVGSIYMSAVNVSPASFLGGTWQAIEQGRMLMAAGSSWQAGTTGGAAYHTLTVQEMPAHDHSATETAAGGHTHGASTDSAGAHSHSGGTNNAGNHYHTGTTNGAGWHSHTRGSMNITGAFWNLGSAPQGTSGAIYPGDAPTNHSWIDSHVGTASGVSTNFDASRSWTGSTSTDGGHSHGFSTSWAGEHAHSLSIISAGAHTHSVAIAAAGAHTHAITIGRTGSGAAFSILPPYIAVYMWRRTA